MNALEEAKEINLWTCTEEEQQEWERQQKEKEKDARVAASPKFQYGEKRSETLLDILLSTPRPELVTSRKSPDIPSWRIEFERWQEAQLVRLLLGHKVHSYHIGKRTAEPKFDVLLDRRWRQCLEYISELEISFRIGSALALYEQMDRAGRVEPSLSKAYRLLTKAPDLDGVPRPGFGSPDAIAHAWKHHYHFAHYWAAYVAMTGEPFSFDPATLVIFACKASLGRFRRLAATYLKFRRDVRPPRSKQKSYIKQGLDDYRNVQDIAGAQPMPRELLPNLLNAQQWNVLDNYSVNPRKDRA